MSATQIVHDLMFVTAVVTLAAWTVIALLVTFGNRKIANLQQVAGTQDPSLPRVSIVVSARDEQQAVERAILSMLQQAYPDYEVIAVDDRSTDATGEILERIAASDNRLRVLRIPTLPPGWLGKNHSDGCFRARTGGSTSAGTTARPPRGSAACDRPRLPSPRGVVRLRGLLFSIYAQPWRAKVPPVRSTSAWVRPGLCTQSAFRVLVPLG